jgi:hypothetical protein
VHLLRTRIQSIKQQNETWASLPSSAGASNSSPLSQRERSPLKSKSRTSCARYKLSPKRKRSNDHLGPGAGHYNPNYMYGQKGNVCQTPAFAAPRTRDNGRAAWLKVPANVTDSNKASQEYLSQSECDKVHAATRGKRVIASSIAPPRHSTLSSSSSANAKTRPQAEELKTEPTYNPNYSAVEASVRVSSFAPPRHRPTTTDATRSDNRANWNDTEAPAVLDVDSALRAVEKRASGHVAWSKPTAKPHQTDEVTSDQQPLLGLDVAREAIGPRVLCMAWQKPTPQGNRGSEDTIRKSKDTKKSMSRTEIQLSPRERLACEDILSPGSTRNCSATHTHDSSFQEATQDDDSVGTGNVLSHPPCVNSRSDAFAKELATSDWSRRKHDTPQLRQHRKRQRVQATALGPGRYSSSAGRPNSAQKKTGVYGDAYIARDGLECVELTCLFYKGTNSSEY